VGDWDVEDDEDNRAVEDDARINEDNWADRDDSIIEEDWDEFIKFQSTNNSIFIDFWLITY
jgi:hypothetical protein